jgi:MFS family permease
MSIAAMVLLGLGDSGRRSLNASLIMEQSDESHRGRVMGVYMLNFGLMPLGAIPIGFLADAANIRLAFALAGGLLAGVAVVATVATRRVRRL